MNLYPGDTVMWKDPDDGACSRRGVLKGLTRKGEGMVHVVMEDGWEADVLENELELLCAVDT